MVHRWTYGTYDEDWARANVKRINEIGARHFWKDVTVIKTEEAQARFW